MRKTALLVLTLSSVIALHQAHDRAQTSTNTIVNPNTYQDLRWRSIGPHRGGRSTAAAGVRTQPNVFYMGATGGGVWKTENFGITWVPVSGGPASEGGVYKTTDGGDHWTRAANGFPDDLIGKVWVAIAQSNPKVVYAQVEAKGAKGGLYRSNDGAASWTLVNSSQRLRARPFYFNKAFVNPKDENEVYVTELGFHRSTDGGRTFSTLNPQHGDNHVMWINPDNPKIFIETNDGGANITENAGRSFSSEMNQPTAEIYMVDADEEFPYRLVGPQQDN